MKGALILAIVSLLVTPIWMGVLILKPAEIYQAVATFIEVCAIGTFSLGVSQVIDYTLHPEQQH